MSHTPGPWTYEVPDCEILVGNDRLASLDIDFNCDDETLAANGRLMAAAPDLLAAAEAGLDLLMAVTNHDCVCPIAEDQPIGEMYDGTPCVYCQLGSAINKAKAVPA